ncbi:MAG: hypothetical protein QOG50_983 [Actinomycetota bacterium]|nr:hypothetical protein [Actinomycetota bacterium]
MTWCACAPAFGATASGARYLGSASRLGLKRPIVGMAATPSGKGYWLVAADGGIFNYGDAHFYGSTGSIRLNQPIVGMAATPTGRGYWLVAADGGIFSFGNAHFYGSTGSRQLNRPIVGMRAAPNGSGYWLVASDGGIFTFGTARFHGSTGGRALNQPIVGMAATPGGKGYWLVAADGGIFTFGTARYRGAATSRADPAPIVGIATTPSGLGYWIASAGGRTLAFGDARPLGTRMSPAQGAVVAIAASPRNGYWVAARDGTVGTSTGNPSRTAMIAFELLRRMNDERAARHLRPLAWDGLLAGFANSWAHTLVTSSPFRHQDLGAIIVGAGGTLEEVGENLFAGDGTSADAGTAHLALMGSAEHRQNMLLPQGQLVGIGVVCSGIKLIVVEDFGITMGAPLPPANQAQAPANPVVSTNSAGAHC